MNRRKIFLLCVSASLCLCMSCAKVKIQQEDDMPEKPKTESSDLDNSVPEGWKYFGGDEFNDTSIDPAKWVMYGAKGVGERYYGCDVGEAIHEYRPEQISLSIASTGEKVLHINSIKKTDGDSIKYPSGNFSRWWSGAIFSRGVKPKPVYYPLFCRIDIRAKLANEIGIWHGLWCRHYLGSKVAELDLAELFMNEDDKKTLRQAFHVYNNLTHTLEVNVPKGQNRRETANSDLGKNFHIYTVQVDKHPTNPEEAVITFLVDNIINYSFSTDRFGAGIYNKFITQTLKENRSESAWDIVFTGQIGGKDSGIRYPDNALNRVSSEIDWIRVYIRK